MHHVFQANIVLKAELRTEYVEIFSVIETLD